ncbi:MAG: hypothetical protein ACI4I7_05155 [Oscillospiraceae bacterium]
MIIVGLLRNFLIIILAFIVFIFSSGLEDEVVESLPDYDYADEYYSNGFQDYTDYVKYYYDDIDYEDLENSLLNSVEYDDINNIFSYIDDFCGWAINHEEVQAGYDFSVRQLQVGDYYYIDTKEGEPIGDSYYGKFDDYSVYYFDVDKQILYYFHNNI